MDTAGITTPSVSQIPPEYRVVRRFRVRFRGGGACLVQLRWPQCIVMTAPVTPGPVGAPDSGLRPREGPRPTQILEPAVGIEPTTCCLQAREIWVFTGLRWCLTSSSIGVLCPQRTAEDCSGPPDPPDCMIQKYDPLSLQRQPKTLASANRSFRVQVGQGEVRRLGERSGCREPRRALIVGGGIRQGTTNSPNSQSVAIRHPQDSRSAPASMTLSMRGRALSEIFVRFGGFGGVGRYGDNRNRFEEQGVGAWAWWPVVG